MMVPFLGSSPRLFIIMLTMLCDMVIIIQVDSSNWQTHGLLHYMYSTIQKLWQQLALQWPIDGSLCRVHASWLYHELSLSKTLTSSWHQEPIMSVSGLQKVDVVLYSWSSFCDVRHNIVATHPLVTSIELFDLSTQLTWARAQFNKYLIHHVLSIHTNTTRNMHVQTITCHDNMVHLPLIITTL